ncbi:MAG: FliG C-terminal domain-containing protein [Polyangiaceae bacterium]
MLSNAEKAVVLLLSLDERVAAPIIAELTDAELRQLRSVAATMHEVSNDALDETYRDFVDRTKKAVAVPRGLPYLRKLTVEAHGEERARTVFEDAPRTVSPLARLQATDPETVAALLAKETPQLAAAILTRLEPLNAAAILASMPEERQAAVVRRVSSMTKLPATALEDVAAALAAELPTGESTAYVNVDGMARAAAILNAAPQTLSTNLLTALETDQPELSRDLRLAMFTFADLARLDSKAMRVLLREVPTNKLTLALKNAPDEVSVAIFAGLSTRAAEVIKDDLALLGSAKKRDIEAARTEVIEIALRLETEGSIDLGRGA